VTTATPETSEPCTECELNDVELPVDGDDRCVDCRTADLVWVETYYGSGRRVTRASVSETADGEGQSVVVDQRWETEADVDRVGLPATRIDTIRDMLVAGAERAEFEDQFGADDPVDGTTTVEVGEAAVVSQKLAPESVADVVTLTSEMLLAIRRELRTTGGDGDAA